MGFNIFSLLEDPTFMFFFHELICILGSLYYIAPMVTRIREKREGKPYTTSWKSQKDIVAVYIVVAESIFLYDDVNTNGIINAPLAIFTQVLAVIIIAAAYIILKEGPQVSAKNPLSSTKKRK